MYRPTFIRTEYITENACRCALFITYMNTKILTGFWIGNGGQRFEIEILPFTSPRIAIIASIAFLVSLYKIWHDNTYRLPILGLPLSISEKDH